MKMPSHTPWRQRSANLSHKLVLRLWAERHDTMHRIWVVGRMDSKRDRIVVDREHNSMPRLGRTGAVATNTAKQIHNRKTLFNHRRMRFNAKCREDVLVAVLNVKFLSYSFFSNMHTIQHKLTGVAM